MTDIKFCGMTRAEDVHLAVEVGAAYVGAIFAGGPRALTPQRARALFEDVIEVRRVGVFGDQPVDEIVRVADVVGLDVIQLHGDPAPDFVSLVKAKTGRETWAAIRVAKTIDEAALDAMTSSADAILFDSRGDGALGGTGRTFDWPVLTKMLDQHPRVRSRFVLAGGLTPELVPRAIAALHPAIVDVSSGVESAPGIKDPERMRAFAAAVRGAA